MNINKKKTTKEYLNRHKLGQFFTSESLVNVICDTFNLELSHQKILEPSFGGCSFIKTLLDKYPSAKITAIDIDAKLCKKYSQIYPDVDFICKDFLKYNSQDSFDLVIGNPPFNLKASNYYDTTEGFVIHSIDLLKPGGLLIFVLPSTVLRNKQYENLRKFILEKCKIIKILNTSSYDFFGADIETIVLGLKKEQVSKQEYHYLSKDSDDLINLTINGRKTIKLFNSTFLDEINTKLSSETLGDLFNIERGRSNNEFAIKGRDIDFYGNHLYRSNDIPFIGLQNIAYRLTGNVINAPKSNIRDTITMLLPKSECSEVYLKFICDYLNSSIANYLIHVGALNNSKLTIHIDKYYIQDLKVPMFIDKYQEFIKENEKNVHSISYGQKRNEFFYQLMNLTKEEINEIERIWTFPRYKKKKGEII